MRQSKRFMHYRSPSANIGANHARLLLSLLGNYSLRVKDKLCVNGRLLEFSSQLSEDAQFLLKRFAPVVGVDVKQGSVTYTIKLENKANQLHFVSCGRRGMDSLLFSELVAVFDIAVWVGVIFSMTGVLKILSFSTYGFSTLVFSVIKLLAGQSNPMPDRIFTMTTLNPTTIPLLFMGVVMFEAYKNTNVYRMVIPRHEVPYEHLQELIQDNFTIHSRAASVLLTKTSKKENVFNFSYTFANNQRILFKGIGGALSEVERVIKHHSAKEMSPGLSSISLSYIQWSLVLLRR